jgi:hypothetical protein
MKHYLILGLLLINCSLLIVNCHKNSNSNNKSKGKGKSSKEVVSIPINLKISQDSFVGASILKALGVSKSMEYLIVKIQKNCKRLKVIKIIRLSIKVIKRLTAKTVENGFDITEASMNNIFGKAMKSNDLRALGLNYRQGRKIFGKGDLIGRNFRNNLDQFRATVGKKKSSGRKGKKSKMSKLEKQCRLKGFYNLAMGKIYQVRMRLRKLRRRQLIKVIKRTFRRILARMLGCYYVRYGKFSKIIRKAQRQITTKGIGSKVEQLTQMLIQMSKNYRPKKKSVKKSKKMMKKIYSKIILGKKINFKTKILLKKLSKNNCKAANQCFNSKVYSRKCFQVSRLCLTIKSIVKKIKAKKVGTVVSKILKQFFKKK